MMPHLGVLAQVDTEAAQEIFKHDCLVSICHAIVPVYKLNLTKKEIARVFFNGTECGKVLRGIVTHSKECAGQSGMLRVEPLHGSIDIGAGYGKIIERKVTLGAEGLLFDGRNRPLTPEKIGGHDSIAALYAELGLI